MLESLNDKQKDAVLAPGHILLTACPGSGKTRVLAFKVASELAKIKSNKRKIVALTFTNRAADEIKKRLIRMDVDSSKLWAGTIHAFCLEWLLRPYASYLEDLKNGFVIADEYKSEHLISTLKKEYGFEWWERITTRRLTDGSFAEPDAKYHKLLQNYHQALRSQKLIDFDLLLYYAYHLLNKYKKIRKTLNNMFHLICVDEYQDTQELQYSILSNIMKVDHNKTLLFMVGDKDQAIYGSLGGVAKSLEEVKSQFGGIDITEMELSGNYRSTQRLIDYYRHFQNAGIEIKSLSPQSEENGLITFNTEIHKDKLAEHIASLIEHNIQSGVPEHEICVLAPQWYLVIPMGRKLKRLLPNVNFDAIGLSPLLKNKENIWFKVARLLLVTPSPRMYLTRSRWADELIEEIESSGIQFPLGVERKSKTLLKLINSVSSKHTNGLEYLEDCFNSLLSLLGIVIKDFPLLKEHWEYFFEGCRNRLDNPEFDYAKDIASFKRLFSHNSGVVVNTCHGIKGEEFHTVIAFGLLHGFIPNWNENDKANASRKLLYVICSRSKKHLHLISERGRKTRGGMSYQTTGHLKNFYYEYD